ncbi:MAG: hypothetical protein JWQ50_3260 [Caballeronia mineralivorans]|nr:hypothetical protein [Caballeronia mineralivorans]
MVCATPVATVTSNTQITIFNTVFTRRDNAAAALR